MDDRTWFDCKPSHKPVHPTVIKAQHDYDHAVREYDKYVDYVFSGNCQEKDIDWQKMENLLAEITRTEKIMHDARRAVEAGGDVCLQGL